MTDDDLRQLVKRITGDDIYDAIRDDYDFSHRLYCASKRVELVATTLRIYRYPIGHQMRRSITNVEAWWLAELPDFVCLECDRSLVVPRPYVVSTYAFEDAVAAFVGSLASFRRKPFK